MVIPNKDAVMRETIQSLAARQYMTEQEYENHVTDAIARHGSQDSANVQDVTLAINKSLKFMHLCIRKIKFPGDGEFYVGLANTIDDDISKEYGLSKLLDNKHGLRVFRPLFTEFLSRGAEKEIGSRECLNLACLNEQSQSSQDEGSSQTAKPDRKPLTVAEATSALEILCKEGWLFEASGSYQLGPRSHIELHEDIEKSLQIESEVEGESQDPSASCPRAL